MVSKACMRALSSWYVGEGAGGPGSNGDGVSGRAHNGQAAIRANCVRAK